MNSKRISLFLALALAVSLMIPSAGAAGLDDSTYAAIYDAADIMDEEAASSLTMDSYKMAEEYGCALYWVTVDTYTDYTDGGDINNAAEEIYNGLELGVGEDRSGLLLLLSVSDGLTALYSHGYGDVAFTDYGKEQLTQQFAQPFADEAWYLGATNYMDYGEAMLRTARDSVPLDAPQESGTEYVFMEMPILSPEETADLEESCRTASETYNCGVYIAVVADYHILAPNGDAFDAATAFYKAHDLGMGEGKDGILLFLSMGDRDYYLISYGRGTTVMNDEGKNYAENNFLDDFGDDQWYAGFTDYIAAADMMLEMESEGNPYDAGDNPAARTIGVVICIAIGFAVAFGVVGGMKRKMHSVAEEEDAGFYVTEEGAAISEKRDDYIRTTRSRVYNPRKKDSDSGSRSGGGFSGSGGKF